MVSFRRRLARSGRRCGSPRRTRPRPYAAGLRNESDRNGELRSHPQSRTFAELLIDCEEDRTLRAVLRRDAAGGCTLSEGVRGRAKVALAVAVAFLAITAGVSVRLIREAKPDVPVGPYGGALTQLKAREPLLGQTDLPTWVFLGIR